MKEIVIDSESSLTMVAESIIEKHSAERVFGFFGEMGSGKTTLIKEICRQLGVHDDMTSPTFSIVNEYFRENGEPVYHFDFYRIDSPDDALRIGFPDYIASGCYCFMEWTENVLPLLGDDFVPVKIEQTGETSRKFTF